MTAITDLVRDVNVVKKLKSTLRGTRTHNLWIRSPTRYPLRQQGLDTQLFIPNHPEVLNQEFWKLFEHVRATFGIIRITIGESNYILNACFNYVPRLRLIQLRVLQIPCITVWRLRFSDHILATKYNRRTDSIPMTKHLKMTNGIGRFRIAFQTNTAFSTKNLFCRTFLNFGAKFMLENP